MQIDPSSFDPDNLLEALLAISPCQHYHRWIYHNIKNELGNSILDVGSGLGDVAQFFGDEGRRKVILSDCCDTMLRRLTDKFGTCPNFEVLKLNFIEEPPPSALEIDTITCINVLEHIENDCRALAHMHKLLPANGNLVLVVPYGSFLYGTFDKLGGHFRRYNRPDLNGKIHEAGFSIRKQYFMNFFGIFTWFVAGKVLRRKCFPSSTVQNLNLWVPFLEKIERLIRPPIGQSIITIAVK